MMKPCPCPYVGCSAYASRLNKRGHAWGCKCPSCVGSRSRSKGRDAQARMHKRLGGARLRSSHEEAARPYPVNLAVESKAGASVPREFHKAVETEWFKAAIEQAREQLDEVTLRAVIAGDAGVVYPAVYIELSRNRWIVVAVGGTAP